MLRLVVEGGVKKYSMKYSYIQANMSLTWLLNEREWIVCTLIWNTMFILFMMSKDPIKLTMLQGPFGAINPSQIQQLMQQVGDKNAMFFGQNVLLLKYRKWKVFFSRMRQIWPREMAAAKDLNNLFLSCRCLFV